MNFKESGPLFMSPPTSKSNKIVLKNVEDSSICGKEFFDRLINSKMKPRCYIPKDPTQ